MKRRTQAERKAATVKKLLDAATDTLIELGYAETSVQRICARAELSQGALFRHFATREELMVAVGEAIGAQLLERFQRRFATLGKRDADLAAALRLVREACRSPLNQAWYELVLAARTSEALRKGMEPVARRYFDNIVALARTLLPELATTLGPTFELLVTTVIAMFDGEAVERFVLKNPRLEDARIDLFAQMTARLVQT